MSQEIAAVYEELVRLKDEGLERLAVAPETLAAIEKLLPAQTAAPETNSGTQTSKQNPPQTTTKDTTEKSADSWKPTKADPTQTSKAKPTQATEPAIPELAKPPVIDIPDGERAAQMAALQSLLENCSNCKSQLKAGENFILGRGSLEAKILFCGDAPSTEDAKSGKAYSDDTGTLLLKIIQAMKLDESDVYLTNMLKWRPQHDKPYGNRPPNDAELKFNLPYLEAQIKIIQPQVVIALGNSAVSGFLGLDPKRRLGDIRGKWQQFKGTDLMITFHPNYLLRNNTLKTKRLVWEDLLEVLRRIDAPITPQQEAFFLPKK
jgi:DNA polymerase